jgi:hypothetical protein
MSWNISTRLNNLQQQINNIANEGLTNPLEQILNANNYSLTNLSILDAGSNILKLQSNNIAGIETNCSGTFNGDLTCNTLNYSVLNPPINTGEIEYTPLNSDATQNSFNNFTFISSNPYTGIITKTAILNPTVSGTITFSAINGDNSIAFGFSNVNTLYPTGGALGVLNGVYFYPSSGSLGTIINGNINYNYPFTEQLTLDFILKCVNGLLKVYINNNEITQLEQPLASGNYYFSFGCYCGGGVTCNISDLNANQSTNETLNEVLTNGNSAGGLDINDIGEINAESINASNSIYAEGYLQAGNKAGLSAIQLLYGDGTSSGNNYQIIGVNDTYVLQQYKNNTLTAQPLLINQETLTQFKSTNLVYTQDGTNNYYILDSNFNTPCYKQIFSNLNQTVNGMGANASPFFSIPIYTKNPAYNYGVNYAEILFSSLNLTFTSSTIFGTNLTATLFLSSTNSGEYNPAVGNSIQINITNTNGVPTYTFNSSIPIILYYNNTTQFNKLYLLVAYNVVTLTNYNLQITNSNMAITSYVSSNPQGAITWGA